MTTLTGVGGWFCAAHSDPVRTEIHGHTYEVVAWFEASPSRDAVVLQEALNHVLRGFDHRPLPPELTRAEAFAETIMFRLEGCVEVQINRPLERIYAIVRR